MEEYGQPESATVRDIANKTFRATAPSDSLLRETMSLSAVFLILAAVLVLGALNLDRIPYLNGDAQVHLLYLDYFKENGVRSYPGIFQEYLSREWMIKYHSPIMVSYFMTAFGMSKLVGISLGLLTWISLLSHLCLTLLVYIFARRWLNGFLALVLCALAAFSPLGLACGTAPLVDAFNTLFLSISLWVFFMSVQNPRNTKIMAIFVAVFTFTLITKETNVLFSIPMFAYALIKKLRSRQSVRLVPLFLMMGVSFVLAGCVFLAVTGGVSTLLKLMKAMTSAGLDNPYVTQLNSGPWYRYLIDFFLLSPWVTLLALLYAGRLTGGLPKGEKESQLAVYLVVLIVSAIAIHAAFPKCVRYVAVLDIPFRIFALLLLWEVFCAIKPEHARILTVLAVCAICGADIAAFLELFVENKIYDPLSISLLGARHMIPPFK